MHSSLLCSVTGVLAKVYTVYHYVLLLMYLQKCTQFTMISVTMEFKTCVNSSALCSVTGVLAKVYTVHFDVLLHGYPKSVHPSPLCSVTSVHSSL